jgi:hypothetical protein
MEFETGLPQTPVDDAIGKKTDHKVTPYLPQ